MTAEKVITAGEKLSFLNHRLRRASSLLGCLGQGGPSSDSTVWFCQSSPCVPSGDLGWTQSKEVDKLKIYDLLSCQEQFA